MGNSNKWFRLTGNRGFLNADHVVWINNTYDELGGWGANIRNDKGYLQSILIEGSELGPYMFDAPVL